jgi:hypothetical protein
VSHSTLHANKTRLHTIFANIIENDQGIGFNFAHRLLGFDTSNMLAMNKFNFIWPFLLWKLKKISKTVWLGLYTKLVDFKNI